MTKPKPKDQLRKVGRPLIVQGEVLKKLDEAFAIGCTDEEACIFADISMTTLYNHQERNPEYVDRKELLKKRPFLKARNTVVRDIGSPDTAMWYLERKGKDEFSNKSNLALSGRVEIEESINKIIDVLGTDIPEDCPHCHKRLDARENISKKLMEMAEGTRAN